MSETQTSPYGIDEDHRETLEARILKELDREHVAKAIKKSLEAHCDEAINHYTDYLKGEYALVIEDIAKDRAKRLVIELLKGNHEVAQFFCLEARSYHYGPDAGKPFVYDPDGIRRAILETFKDEIATAEMIALREENERLLRDVKFYRELRRY